MFLHIMKKTIIFCILILLSLNATAIEVQQHLIEVELNEDGFAKIIEKYELRFEDILEIDSFNKKAQQNSSSILAWRADFEFFAPRFENSNNRIIRSSISYEEIARTLILEYELEKPLASILKDEPREILFSISGQQLNFFIEEGLIVIPHNTQITITTPINAQILGHNSPAQIPINNNTVFLSGISTSHIDIRYIISKPISTTVNSLELIQEFFSTSSNIIIIVIVLLLIVGIFWKKDRISKKIEDYIVEHSEIEHSGTEEEIELEV